METAPISARTVATTAAIAAPAGPMTGPNPWLQQEGADRHHAA